MKPGRWHRVRMTVWVVIAMGALIPSPGAAQQDQPEITAQDLANNTFLHQIAMSLANGKRIDNSRAMALSLFLNADLDGGGISQSDRTLRAQLELAQGSSFEIGQWARSDLDGDGIVTREEIMRAKLPEVRRSFRVRGAPVEPTPEQLSKVWPQIIERELAADKNGDGRVTLDEVVRNARSKKKSSSLNAMEISTGFDTNGDGTISLDEFEAGIDALFRVIDKNGNGIYDEDEAASTRMLLDEVRNIRRLREREERTKQRLEVMKGTCAAPSRIEGARLILVSGFKGKGVSNISIGGDDLEVGAAHIEIEKGTEPLEIYVVTSGATIFHVTGARERVARMVVTSNQSATADKRPRAGVVGLPRERVAFLESEECLQSFSKVASPRAYETTKAFEAIVGTKPDAMFAEYGIARVGLPSGTFTKDARLPSRRNLPAAGPGQTMWRAMQRYAPAGLADFEAQDVVASYEARPYAILPQEAGIAQLLDDGAIVAEGRNLLRRYGTTTIVGELNVIKVQPDETYYQPSRFRILKAITFPAGLNGGHSGNFVLGKGVPLPSGSPGHSCVMEEETGKPILGSQCH